MEKISVVISFVCLFAVGTQAWPHGSVDTCPDGTAPDCPYVPSGIHDYKFPHPTDCHYFIHCDAGGEPICKECPAELHFNNETKDCDWPDIAKCESGPIPTALPPATTLAPPAPTDDTSVTTVSTPEPDHCETDKPECPKCKCGEREPHPDECEWYFECEGDQLHLRKCERGWHFDPINKVCNYPCYAGCDNSSGGSGGPSVTPVPPPAGNETCPSTGGKAVPKCPETDPDFSVFFAHPADCGWFYHCSHGVAYCKNCPAGLHWNTKLDVCDWPVSAGCTV